MRSIRLHNRESGMAMVLVITILAALLGIAAVGLSIQLNSTKSTALIKDTRASLYCAEAGLQAARTTFVDNRPDWGVVLAGGSPAWYAGGITGDADNDGTGGDYIVTMTDDGDDTDPKVDSNDTIVLTSRCVLYEDIAPATVVEVLSLRGLGHSYRMMSGQGGSNSGNANQ